MTIRAFVCVAVIAGCLQLAIGPGTASAAVLAADPAAMTAWQGTKQYIGLIPVPPYTERFRAKVDYAVYAPGAFQTSTALGNPADPSGGQDYVYAYQIYDTSGTQAINFLNVGFTDLTEVQAGGSGGLPGAFASPTDPAGGAGSDLLPWSAYFVAGSPPNPSQTAARWLFYKTGTASVLTNSAFSGVLYYTSPLPPAWKTATLQSASAGDTEDLPSPLPEPAGLMLVVATMAWLGTRRSR